MIVKDMLPALSDQHPDTRVAIEIDRPLPYSAQRTGVFIHMNSERPFNECINNCSLLPPPPPPPPPFTRLATACSCVSTGLGVTF